MSSNFSNSKFQSDQENQILDAFNSQYSFGVSRELGKITCHKINFQFDFANNSQTVIGEIYTCSFPLKPGHQRKINTDILKMVTYEKLIGSRIEKYLILTVSEVDFKNYLELYKENSLVIDSDSISMFGFNSWFKSTLTMFNIQLYYYCLSESDKSKLEEVRANQRNIMKR